MYRHVATYTDYEGIERKEEFFFNLNKGEVMDMDFSTEGGLKKMLEKIINEKDGVKITAMFKEIVRKSYGVKSPDGKHFWKKPEYLADFMATEAYSDLIVKLYTDAEFSAKFVNGILPKVEQPNQSSIPAPV